MLRVYSIAADLIATAAALFVMALVSSFPRSNEALAQPPSNSPTLNTSDKDDSGRISVDQFPTVNTLHTSSVHHLFALTNTTSIPLTITALQASCGCTTAVLQDRSASTVTLLYTLEPGKQIQVAVTTNLQYLQPGPLDKFVSVMAQGQAVPIATFEMKGVLAPPVEISPAVLDFGDVAAGTGRSLLVSVARDPALLAAREVPVVMSPSPDLTVQQVPGVATGTADEPAPEAPNVRAITQTYRVSLSPNAPCGVPRESLAWVVPALTEPSVDLGGSLGTMPARVIPAVVVPIPVTGDVVGPVSASPGFVDLSDMPGSAGKGGLSQQVVLSGKNAADLVGLGAVSDSPQVTARLSLGDGRTPGWPTRLC